MSSVPPALPPAELESIVQEVLSRLGSSSLAGGSAAVEGSSLFTDLDSAVDAAERAFLALQETPLERRKDIIQALRRTSVEQAAYVSRLAVEETGLGRADDKVVKNTLVAEKTPGPEILVPWAVSGDSGLTLEELAPWGVIGSITPCTNPTETIINNSISMVSAGNSVVFCPHPLARRVSSHMIAALNRAVVSAGGPSGLISGISQPSIELAQGLMRHAKIRLVVVTGGPDVVKEAMRSGKRVIGAGPGNPPSLVDETADLERAGRDLVRGASLDNNIVCTDEKEVIAVASTVDRLKAAMESSGAQEVHGPQIARLEQLVLASRDGREARVKKEWIGKDAARFLEAIGARPTRDVRLIIAEVPADHPFVWTELLMPILPIVRIRQFDEAMELAVAAEKNCRHTATMHSRDVERLSRMARRINCSIFVKNGPAYAGLGQGGEGYTSFTIAGPTGEGMTTARTFCRLRRCALVDSFRII